MPNTARPICEITVSLVGRDRAGDAGEVRTCRGTSRRRATPIDVSVVRALRASGGLNAGTPFETASTPVIALQPSANARISRSSPSVSGRDDDRRHAVDRGGSPSSARPMPIAISASIETRKT